MHPEPTVFIVDDDEAVRTSLLRLMESVGLATETYPSARGFLDAYELNRPGCLLLDIRMPGMSGLELQRKLVGDGIHIPIIIISAHGTVETAVSAMKTGAVDFIRKPFDAPALVERVRRALVVDAQIRRRAARRADVTARVALLTPREREVLELLAAGKATKQIGMALGVCRRTVDIHRSHIMMKMNAESLVELANMLQIESEPPVPPHIAHAYEFGDGPDLADLPRVANL